MPAPPLPNPNASQDEGAADASDSDELVTVSRWELDALRAKASSSAHGPVDAPSIEAVVPPSVVVVDEEASRTRRIEELERGYKAAIRDRELATALAGRSLVPGAAAQLIKLWREDFDVYEEGGEYRVAARDGRAVVKAVAERLGEAEYAHFSPPSSRGGASARGSGRTSGPDAASAPRTLGDAALQRWRESASARADPATGPIGLRRR